MYIIKNAFVSITRNIGRNLLIGIIVVVISCAVTITLAIRNSASSLISSYESKYDVTASIGFNRESMMGQMKRPEEGDFDKEEMKENMGDIFSSASQISIDDINNYGDSSYVKDYYYQISIGVNGSNIDKVSMSTSDSNRPSMPGRENFSNRSSSDFTLVGYSTLSSMEEFINGKYKITDGSVSIDDNNCVINSELATLNDISVGDEIEAISPDDEEITIKLKVSGIYEEESESSEGMNMFSNSANNIITNSDIVNTFATDNELKTSITPTFILNNKDVIDNFSNELTEKGLSEYLSVTTNLDQIDNSTKTISNVLSFATTFLIITLVIGAIVLFVINMINIRERRYEIGVLRTIGMKKSLLTFQFITELLIVSLLSLTIGASIGSASSVSVSNYLLKQEISNAQSEKENIQSNFKRGDMGKINGIVNVEEFSSIDAVVDVKVIVELLGIGLLLTLISSSASMISINKFSPLTILKERS